MKGNQQPICLLKVKGSTTISKESRETEIRSNLRNKLMI
uniref:Uncharacterized protein n=1 Tax=Podoviridae sp. ctz6O13 TaxID=2827757 RepID=A0A8S5TLR8_9CAUD|nr:MAG TPA: hypothetical protein [Podoviridae sp. ctz6O13]